MENIIITTPAELRSIVANEVAAILPRLANSYSKNDSVVSDKLTVEGAVQFLANQGVPTTRSTIYNWVFLKKIPFKKVGRRTVFSKKELLGWIESRTTSPEDGRDAAAQLIAHSANKK
ncbi:helix-turn-helix domain-containing protein [Alistipes putredinis]|uniref:helix-turn-helix domain-containing protein n=1 Tax=Alistipes putredinis TaxID=28117 RepID=UPI003AF042E9